jgi:hypothetical protein
MLFPYTSCLAGNELVPKLSKNTSSALTRFLLLGAKAKKVEVLETKDMISLETTVVVWPVSTFH